MNPDILKWEAVKRVQLKDLYARMATHALEWHKNGKCGCMAHVESNSITLENFIPCKHINEEQWKIFRREVESLWNEAKRVRTAKLMIQRNVCKER